MSSIAIFPQQNNHLQYNHAQPQLPITWYADPSVYALEQQYLFANAPKYLPARTLPAPTRNGLSAFSCVVS